MLICLIYKRKNIRTDNKKCVPVLRERTFYFNGYFPIIFLAFLIWFSILETLGPPSTSLSLTHFSRFIAVYTPSSNISHTALYSSIGSVSSVNPLSMQSATSSPVALYASLSKVIPYLQGNLRSR